MKLLTEQYELLLSCALRAILVGLSAKSRYDRIGLNSEVR